MGTFSFVAAEGASFSKEKTIKKEEKNGWPFFVAVELGARGGDLFLGVIRDLGTPLPTFTIWRASPICSITQPLLPLRFPSALSFNSQFCSKFVKGK